MGRLPRLQVLAHSLECRFRGRIFMAKYILTALCASVTMLIAASVQAAVLGEKQNGQTVTLAKGEPLTLMLGSNGTTGFEWQIVELPRNLKRSGQTYLAPEQAAGAPAMAGAGGQQRFTFVPRAKGRGILRLFYRQPWDRRTAPLERYRLTVITR